MDQLCIIMGAKGGEKDDRAPTYRGAFCILQDQRATHVLAADRNSLPGLSLDRLLVAPLAGLRQDLRRRDPRHRARLRYISGHVAPIAVLVGAPIGPAGPPQATAALWNRSACG